jgi:hypothetical protein
MQSPAREGTLRPRRTSAFRETGLYEDQPQSSSRPNLKVRFRSKDDIFESPLPPTDDLEWEDVQEDETENNQYTTVAPMVQAARPVAALIHRLCLVAFILAVIITITHLTPFAGNTKPLFGASGAPFTEPVGHPLSKRAEDPTDYCKRWSQQSAIVNGTLYLYGGQKIISSAQKGNTWSMFVKGYGIRQSLTPIIKITTF